MIDAQAELDRIALLVDTAQDKALRAQVLACDGQNDRAEFFAREAAKASADALHRLLLHGAKLPDATPPPAADSLADLAAMERVRPEAETLVAELRRLLPLAEKIDAARGRALDRFVGGSAGLDLAEDLVQLVARIELDLHGPALAVTGGRE